MAAEAQAPLGAADCSGAANQWFWFLERSSLEKQDMKTKIPQNPAARKNLRWGLCRVSPKLAGQGEQLLCLHHGVLPPSRVLAGGAVSGGQNMQIPRI